MRIGRQTLTAATLTAIRPPVGQSARGVIVGNASQDDVKIIDNSQDQSQYVIVAAGFEKAFLSLGGNFSPFDIVFYLLSTPGGDVTFEWY